MSSNKPGKRPSLLKQQMTILGLEPGDAQAADSERQRIERIDLEPLTLSGHQRPRLTAKPWMSLAAMIALVIFGIRLLPLLGDGDTLRIKGSSKVWVYWERDGEVLPWSEGVSLHNGDRVRAEVLAGEDATAYLAVVAGDGKLLSDPAKVLDGALKLVAGEKKTFPGSFKLVGADEKEKLMVVVCQTGGATEVSQAFKGQGIKVDLDSLPDGCGVDEFPLRGGTAQK